jgi:hypothetical protein
MSLYRLARVSRTPLSRESRDRGSTRPHDLLLPCDSRTLLLPRDSDDVHVGHLDNVFLPHFSLLVFTAPVRSTPSGLAHRPPARRPASPPTRCWSTPPNLFYNRRRRVPPKPRTLTSAPPPPLPPRAARTVPSPATAPLSLSAHTSNMNPSSPSRASNQIRMSHTSKLAEEEACLWVG